MKADPSDSLRDKYIRSLIFFDANSIVECIEGGADVNVETDLGGPLRLLCGQKYSGVDRLPIARYLIAHGADINEHEGIALSYFASYGNESAVRELIELGADTSHISSAAIEDMVKGGFFHLLELLIENGLDPNVNRGEILFNITKFCSLDEVKKYVSLGCNVSFDNSLGIFHQAIKYNKADIVKYYVEIIINGVKNGEIGGVSLKTMMGDGLAEACSKNSLEISKILISTDFISRAFLNKAFRNSCYYGSVDTARFLIESGADIAGDANGTAPLNLAARMGHDEVIDILVAAGAAINKTGFMNGKYITPLEDACNNKHESTILKLLSYGASPILLEKVTNEIASMVPALKVMKRNHISNIYDYVLFLANNKYPKTKSAITQIDILSDISRFSDTPFVKDRLAKISQQIPQAAVSPRAV